MNILKHKRCLVTGATRGIGKEIALALEQEECKVLRVGSKDGDLTTHSGIYKVIELARKELREVDILINCAGTFLIKSLLESTVNDYTDMFNINVLSPWLLSQTFTSDMIQNKWGRIVNIGSISAYQGFFDSSLYCASKHALLGMSRALRGELKSHNIRVYCVSPSATQTDMGKEIPNENYYTFLNPKEIAEYIIFTMKFDNELISEEIRLNRFLLNRNQEN